PKSGCFPRLVVLHAGRAGTDATLGNGPDPRTPTGATTVRVLFSTIPEKSHLYCLTPLAWAARAAGHEVRVASCREFVDTIARTGMTAVGVGTSEGIAEGLRSGRDQQEGDALDWNELDPAKLTYEEELNR